MSDTVSHETIIQLPMCKCGRAPHRAKARNCHFCNAEAQVRYRASLKGPLDRARAVKRDVKARDNNRPGFVYFIQADIGSDIKIGFSTDPCRRMADLQTAASRPLNLLATIPGTVQNEKELHAQFSAHRTVGEWFKPDESILAFINGLRRPTISWASS